jgi:hypothetical protein
MNLWRAHSHSHRRFILIFFIFWEYFQLFWKTSQFVLGRQAVLFHLENFLGLYNLEIIFLIICFDCKKETNKILYDDFLSSDLWRRLLFFSYYDKLTFTL